MGGRGGSAVVGEIEGGHQEGVRGHEWRQLWKGRFEDGLERGCLLPGDESQLWHILCH